MRHIRPVAIAALVVCLNSAAAEAQVFKNLKDKAKDLIETVAAQEPLAPLDAPGTGYLGLVADETPVPGSGVLVQTVKPGAPSQLGGLKDGDIITSINDKPCNRLDDLDAALSAATVGSKLKMTVLRAGNNETLTVTLGRKPIVAAAPPADPLAPAPTLLPPAVPTPTPTPTPAPAPAPADPLLLPPTNPTTPPTPTPTPTPTPPTIDLPAPPPEPKPLDTPLDPPAGGRASLGITVVPLNEQVRADFAISPTVRSGAVIVAVRPGGPADTAGLPRGGVIVKIDRLAVDTADDLIGIVAASRPGQEIEVQYFQGATLTRKTVRLGQAATGVVPAAPAELPPAALPPGSDRPLLKRFENMIDSLKPGEPRTPIGSTILDPSAIKLLFERVQQLEEQNASLEERLKLLEAKLSPTPAAVDPLP